MLLPDPSAMSTPELLAEAMEIVTHYRSRGHHDDVDTGYHRITSWVETDVMLRADALIREYRRRTIRAALAQLDGTER